MSGQREETDFVSVGPGGGIGISQFIDKEPQPVLEVQQTALQNNQNIILQSQLTQQIDSDEELRQLKAELVRKAAKIP